MASGEEAVAQVHRSFADSFQPGESVHISWSPADEISVLMKAAHVVSRCQPGYGWRDCFAAPFVIIVAYSFLTRGRLWRSRATLDAGKLPAPVRSSLPDHSAAVVCDGAGGDGFCAWFWRFPLALFISQRPNIRISICSW